VGRDAEIAHLRRVLGQAGAGHGQVVAIVGEAGVGKSRLTYEFTHSHRVQEWLILDAPSVSYGKATSYLPVIDLLKGYFKIGDRDDHREMREKVTGKLFTLDESLRPLLPALLALLDVPVEDAAWISLDPPQRRQRTLDAVKRLLLREGQVRPLLVVFEDLHWIDSETQALLDSIVESLGSARLLLLVNYRPEYEHRWGSKTAYSQLRLDSLPAESAAQLLAALLGPDPGLAPLTQMLVKRGNPFFLEETVRTLVETGALAGERGAHRLTRPVETLQVPATVQTILGARIDRLPTQEKQLLQAASVIGKDVPYALLAAIAEQLDETLRRGLAHLRSWVITFLAEGYLVVGRIAEAREQGEQAVALARAHQERGWEAWGLKLLGDVHAHEPAEAEQAGDAYRQALALANGLGMRPLAAHCHLGLGKLHAKTDQREARREHLTTATMLYRDGHALLAGTSGHSAGAVPSQPTVNRVEPARPSTEGGRRLLGWRHPHAVLLQRVNQPLQRERFQWLPWR
jgi:hypothetical protein